MILRRREYSVKSDGVEGGGCVSYCPWFKQYFISLYKIFYTINGPDSKLKAYTSHFLLMSQ